MTKTILTLLILIPSLAGCVSDGTQERPVDGPPFVEYQMGDTRLRVVVEDAMELQADGRLVNVTRLILPVHQSDRSNWTAWTSIGEDFSILRATIPCTPASNTPCDRTWVSWGGPDAPLPWGIGLPYWLQARGSEAQSHIGAAVIQTVDDDPLTIRVQGDPWDGIALPASQTEPLFSASTFIYEDGTVFPTEVRSADGTTVATRVGGGLDLDPGPPQPTGSVTPQARFYELPTGDPFEGFSLDGMWRQFQRDMPDDWAAMQGGCGVRLQSGSQANRGEAVGVPVTETYTASITIAGERTITAEYGAGLASDGEWNFTPDDAPVPSCEASAPAASVSPRDAIAVMDRLPTGSPDGAPHLFVAEDQGRHECPDCAALTAFYDWHSGDSVPEGGFQFIGYFMYRFDARTGHLVRGIIDPSALPELDAEA